ncbi:MAG: thermonuclease family protein [Nitrosomonadales bacterium]|nr:thermonuclease family protein [Nitrosomonadales bacterium]
MNCFRTFIAIALLCAAGWTHAAEFTGKVIAVLDGDTLMVMQGSNPLKVRLAEIDAPEVGHAGMGGKPPNSQKAQPYGTAAQQSLAGMVMGKQIQVASRAIDDYGRMVAMVSIAGLNVNHEQVRRGMAWEYSRFHNNRAVLALQREAQREKRGLWAGDEITEPSQWRKLHPSTFVAGAASLAGVSHNSQHTDPAHQPDSRQACARKHCSQMTSCDEARDYLKRCGGKTLDGDGDGMPCESLCVPQKKIKSQ